MLNGKVILIAGSSSGIGRAAAELAAGYGAKVVVHGRTVSDDLIKFAESIKAEVSDFDVTDKISVIDAVGEIVRRLGKIDGLINCVGIPKVVPFLDSTDEDWMETFRVNVLGSVHLCQAIIPYMQESGGKIVNIASVRGYDIGAGIFNTPYATSKAALKNLTASLAKSFAPKININSVSPGFTETGFSKTWNETIWKQINSVLAGRIGQPNEIAELLCFLVSDKASFITGQDFVIDGGLLMSGVK